MAFNGFCFSSGPQCKDKRKRKDRKINGAIQRAEKSAANKVDVVILFVVGILWNSHQNPGKETGDRLKNQNQPDQNTIKFSLDSKRSPESLLLLKLQRKTSSFSLSLSLSLYIYIYIYIYIYSLCPGPRRPGFNPIPKTKNMVFDLPGYLG